MTDKKKHNSAALTAILVGIVALGIYAITIWLNS